MNPILKQIFKDFSKRLPKEKHGELKELFAFYQAFMDGAAMNDQLQQALYDWATINGYACVKIKSIALRTMLEKFVKEKMYPGDKQQNIFL